MRPAVTTQILDGLPGEIRQPLLEARCELAAPKVYLALKRLALLHKAGFNPGG